MKIRAVILDFDGVINDSASLDRAGKRLVKIVRDCGYKIPENIYKKLKDIWGDHGHKLIEVGFGLDSKIAAEIYSKWEGVDRAQPFPLIKGTRRAIKHLRSKEIKVLLLTSRYRKNLMQILTHFNISDLFDFIQANDDWAFSKPNPHTFCFLLNQLAKSYGIRPDECIYVGDTILDFECTTARGLISINTLTGVFDESDFLKAGQKKENIIHSIANLPEWLEKYQPRSEFSSSL